MDDAGNATSVASGNRTSSCYAWGWPDDGRLGFGGAEHDPKGKSPIHHEIHPHPNFMFTREEKDVVKGIAAGGRHSLFLMADGRVSATGWNAHGQLGIRETDSFYKPVDVEGLKKAGRVLFCKQVAAGHATSFALTGEGKIYSWGKNKWGGLGQDFEDDEDPEEDQSKARIVKELMNQPIVDISAGYQHCTCTSFGGRTFAWGRNNYGQLGLGKEAFDAGWIGKPTEIKWRPGSEKVIRLSSGYNHCVCLVEITRPNKVIEITAFAWGCPDDSRLGGCDQRRHFEPQEVHGLTTIVRKNHWVFKDVKCGGAHTLVLEKYNGLVVAWGQGRYGQLGYGNVWDRADPVMIVGLRSVTDLSAGARHSVALVDRVASNDSTDGEVYSWGYNDHGELGLGDCAVRLQPHKLNGLLNADVKVISAGHKHTLCVTDGIAKKVRDLPEYQEFFNLLHSEGMLVYDALKKAMEDKGLNSEFLDTPDAILPGQPGLVNHACEYEGSEPGMQYCIDTIKNPDQNEVIMKMKGPYETTYHCIRCRFQHVCMACARHCHGRHPVKVNFKLRHYADTCQCCEHDICNIRWSHVRHEFDKLALQNDDKCIGIDQIEDVLSGLHDDIEERRGGLPLTSKQKEDDLKAGVDAMHERNNRRKEEELEALGETGDEELQKIREKKKKKRMAQNEADDAASLDGSITTQMMEEEEEKEEEGRVIFKDFEKWYLEYFRQDEIDDT
ncbi:hypothetical protein TrLO_g12383 [Triparma laevis f. longispina]|uniref:RCC1-like domain-containing protein n=1 Tax=Triparma laevis f. longispina TaxID=1714387 RepID=A0A9W7FBN8_9STRA|nr:hypothetical protein TrLO_g12383 [Triparma laevis f. longispina]